MEVVDWHGEVVSWVEQKWIGVFALGDGTVQDCRSLD